MEITNLHFNEDDLLQLLVSVEQYMSKLPEGDYKTQVKRAHDIFDKIWFELVTNEEYFIAGKPF